MEVRRGRILDHLCIEPPEFPDGWDTGCERQRGVTKDDSYGFQPEPLGGRSCHALTGRGGGSAVQVGTVKRERAIGHPRRNVKYSLDTQVFRSGAGSGQEVCIWRLSIYNIIIQSIMPSFVRGIVIIELKTI